ncbi:MAG: large repetitive protein [Pseudomonadota bacterium]|nr:large repetitive protein [Pseudomonadota bacterium]
MHKYNILRSVAFVFVALFGICFAVTNTNELNTNILSKHQNELSAWEIFGESSCISHGPASSLGDRFSPSQQLYIIYSAVNYGRRATVQRYTESNGWEYVGSSKGFSDGATSYNRFGFNANTGELFVGYADVSHGNYASVMKYTGTSWEYVGARGFSNGAISDLSMGISPVDQSIYMFFPDTQRGGRASMMRYDGESWGYVGDRAFTPSATSVSMWFNPSTKEPYVVYIDVNNANKVSVMKYNGESWEYVGPKDFSPSASNARITFNPVTSDVYVAYGNLANSNKVEVMKFNGTSWELVGEKGISSGSIADLSFSFNPVNKEPYLAYPQQNGTDGGNRITVKRFNGSSWVVVGSPAFTSINATEVSMTWNSQTGQPYVIYPNNFGCATIMYNTNPE